MTTLRAGTRPFHSRGSGPVTSMIRVLAVRTVLAASTASSSTTTPSTTMARLPMNAPSSTMTGRAAGGSSTPPSPTPPERWTPFPTCAHPGTDVDVARHHHRPGLDVRAVAHGSRRHDAHARLRQVLLQRELVVELERSHLPDLHLGDGEVEEHCL